MKKKLICALLALCIAATLAAFASSAEEHGHNLHADTGFRDAA